MYVAPYSTRIGYQMQGQTNDKLESRSNEGASMTKCCGRLLKVPEAAEALRLQPSTIRKLISQRRLDVVRLGRAVRIPESAVDAMLTKGYRPALRP